MKSSTSQDLEVEGLNFLSFENFTKLSERSLQKQPFSKKNILSFDELEQQFDAIIDLINKNDSDPKGHILSSFSKFLNQILISEPQNKEHLYLYHNIVLNYWKFLTEKHQQNFKALEMLRKVVPVLQPYIEEFWKQNRNLRFKDKAKHQHDLIMVIYAKQEYGFNNFDEALEITQKNLKKIMKKDYDLNFKHHYIRARIFEKLNKKAQELEEVKECLHFLKFLNKGTEHTKQKSVAQTLQKKKDSLIKQLKKNSLVNDDENKFLGLQSETEKGFRKKSTSIFRKRSKKSINLQDRSTKKNSGNNFFHTRSNSIYGLNSKNKISDTKTKFQSLHGQQRSNKPSKKTQKLFIKKKKPQIVLENDEKLELKEKNYEQMLLRRPIREQANQKKQKQIPKEQKQATNESQDHDLESELSEEFFHENNEKNIVIIEECVKSIQREILQKYFIRKETSKKNQIIVDQEQSDRSSSNENQQYLTKLSEQENMEIQGSQKQFNDFPEYKYNLKNIIFPQFGLIDLVKIKIKRYHISIGKYPLQPLKKYEKIGPDNHARIQIILMSKYGGNYYLCENFVLPSVNSEKKSTESIEDIIKNYNKSIQIPLIQSCKSEESESNSYDENWILQTNLNNFLKTNFFFKNKGVGLSLVANENKFEFKEQKNKSKSLIVSHQIKINKYQEYVRTLNILEKIKERNRVEQIQQSLQLKGKRNSISSYNFYNFECMKKEKKINPINLFKNLIKKYSQKPKFQLKRVLSTLKESDGNKESSDKNIQKNLESYTQKIIDDREKHHQFINFKYYEEQINNFFMEKTTEESYFYYCMKFSLLKIPKKNQIFLRFHNSSSLQYIFKLNNGRTYIIKMTVYQIKQIYIVDKPHIAFFKLELEQKNFRTRLIKLIATSKDLTLILDGFENILEGQMTATKMLSFLIKLSEKIVIRKNIVYNLIGINTEDKRFYLANNFKLESQKSKGQKYFLSPHLKLFTILCQKVIKIKSTNIFYFSVLTVIKIEGSSHVTIHLYIPASQKSWSFSLKNNILTYLKPCELNQIFNQQKSYDQNSLIQIFLEKFLSGDGSNQTKQLWKKLINLMTFQKKINPQRSYLIAKLSNYQAFIKDASVSDFFSANNEIFHIEIALEKNSGSLNFLSKKSITKKRRITRISSNASSMMNKEGGNRSNMLKLRKMLSYDENSLEEAKNIYQSESNSYVVYISLTDMYSKKKINFSYYLCELLSLIVHRDSLAYSFEEVQKNIQMNERVLNCANLNRTFILIKNYFISEINLLEKRCIERIFEETKEYDKFKQKIDSILFQKKQQKQSKISLNRKVTKKIQESKILLLYKKMLLINNKPMASILYDCQNQKLRIYISNNDKCEIKERQIEINEHPMPFLNILPKKIMPGLSKRIFTYHKNMFLLE